MFTFPFTLFGNFFRNVFSTSFDGVDERVSTPIDLSGLSSFTVGGWFNRSSTTHRMDISQSNNTNTIRFKLIRNSDGDVLVLINGAIGSVVSNTTGWQHLICVYDGSLAGTARLKLYIDGVAQTLSFTSTPPTTMPSIDVDLFIGYDNGANVHSEGDFDEVVYFSNAMDQAGITQLYNLGSALELSSHQDFSTLVSWYRMGDGDTAPTIKDNKGANDASMINMDQSNFVQDVP